MHNSHIKSCMIFSKEKQHKLLFPNSQTLKASFDLVHIDVWEPYKYKPHDGFKYFITIMDDYIRITWIHLLSHKVYVFPC